MKPFRAAVVTAVALAVGVRLTFTVSQANAKVNPTPPDPAITSMTQAAAGIVAGRPAYLMTSADETYTAGKAATVGSTTYVPYQRAYRGLPVVGGDFVLVLDAGGGEVFHSVAMRRPIGTLSTTPTITKAGAPRCEDQPRLVEHE